jgi:ABC-type nitrate/sulfonate/bicarbonate transport system substrate-binding protein
MRYFLKKGGLDDQRDVTLSPMAPSAMGGAMANDRIAGFVTSLPWPVIPEHDGTAIPLASSPRGDFPELVPFAYNAIVTRGGFCDQKPSVCKKLLAGYQNALDVIHNQPDEALKVLAKRFPDLDAGVLKKAFDYLRASTPKTLEVKPEGLKMAQEFLTSNGMLKPDATLKSFDGVYSNKYLP